MDIQNLINAKTLSTAAGIVVARDFLLDKLGLQRKPTATASVGGAILLVGVGAAIGAGAALLLAPKSGNEIRGDIAAKAGQIKGKLTKKNGRVGDDAPPSFASPAAEIG